MEDLYFGFCMFWGWLTIFAVIGILHCPLEFEGYEFEYTFLGILILGWVVVGLIDKFLDPLHKNKKGA